MNKEKMICKNCKYHYKEEISFDYPQSCCDKRKAVIEEWFNCNDFEYGDRYIEQLQQENKKLKMINEEYERLNKENYRGFKIINVQEYDIYELLSYKNNWNKLKKWLEKELGDRINPNKDKWLTGVYDAYRETIDKMQELEQGSESE